MTLTVEPRLNGDVLLSYKPPRRLDACSTVRLRIPAAEWADFLTAAKTGGLDCTIRTPEAS